MNKPVAQQIAEEAITDALNMTDKPEGDASDQDLFSQADSWLGTTKQSTSQTPPGTQPPSAPPAGSTHSEQNIETPSDDSSINGEVPSFETAHAADLNALSGKKDPETTETPEAPADGTEQKEPTTVPTGKDKSISDLRSIITKVEGERDAAQGELVTLRNQVKELTEAKPDHTETMNGMNTQITELQQRVAELEPYEMVFALYKNPMFRRRYIEGGQHLAARAGQVIKDYALDPSVFNVAVTLGNKKERNDFLRQRVTDDDARAELKILIDNYQALKVEQGQIESTPAQTLAHMDNLIQEEAVETAKTRATKSANASHAGWTLAVKTVSEGETALLELTPIPGNHDHNDKTVTPILNQGKQFHDEICRQILEHGGSVSPGLARYIGAICATAASARTIDAGRKMYYDMYSEAKTKLDKVTRINRPDYSGGHGAGSGGGTPPSGAPKEKNLDGKTVAERVAFEVMNEGVQ